MILPTIHRNGTSAADLQQGYDAIAEASRALEQALAAVEFNARDYYVQGDDAWTKAREQHASIRTKAREITEYTDAIREHLYA